LEWSNQSDGGRLSANTTAPISIAKATKLARQPAATAKTPIQPAIGCPVSDNLVLFESLK
jgi:hypothetical protein